MTSSDVDDVARLINQLHPDQPGVIRPERVRQGWRALVARNDEGGAVEFLLGRSSTTGWLTKSAGTLEQLVIDESVHGQSIGTELVERWKSWLIAEGVPLVLREHGTGRRRLLRTMRFPNVAPDLGSCGQPNETDPGALLRCRRRGLRT